MKSDFAIPSVLTLSLILALTASCSDDNTSNGEPPQIVLDAPVQDAVIDLSSIQSAMFFWQNDPDVAIEGGYKALFSLNPDLSDANEFSADQPWVELSKAQLADIKGAANPAIIYWAVKAANGETVAKQSASKSVTVVSDMLPLAFGHDYQNNNNIDITNNSDGSITLSTTGGDPYVYTDRIGRILNNEHTYFIWFEYKLNKNITNAEFFYCIRGFAEGGKETGANIALQETNEWKTFLYEIPKDGNSFVYDFGSLADHFLRFDPASDAGFELTVRNFSIIADAQRSDPPLDPEIPDVPDASLALLSPMQYLENSRIKIGIDLRIGGSVTEIINRNSSNDNLINSFDWGRQIQMSYYSGPKPFFGPHGETPLTQWAYLGWNPIQSGDAAGNASQVLNFDRPTDNSMLVRCRPMQWPHNGVKADCIFECLYTLNDNVITMQATIINNRSDHTQYNAADQEMPAVYTNGPWYQIVTYLGDKPFSGEPVTTVVTKGDGKGWPWLHFYTPENWVALLNDNGVGIGVFQPDVMNFSGGFYPSDAFKGVGGEKDSQTGYVTPVGNQILDYNIQWTYQTYFVLGNINDIRNFAKEHRSTAETPDWTFSNSRRNWRYDHASDTGWPVNNALYVTFGNGQALLGPVTFWNAENAPLLEIEGAFNVTGGNLIIDIEIQPVGKSDFTDWLNEGDGIADEHAAKDPIYPATPLFSVRKNITADGVKRTVAFDLSNEANYTGAIKFINIRFRNSGTATINRIGFRK